MCSTLKFQFLYARTYFSLKQLLQSLYYATVSFDSVLEEVQVLEQQREFDVLRNRQDGLRASAPRLWKDRDDRMEKLVGVDANMLHCGFIKVDGVYRDIQYYASTYREHSRPQRAVPTGGDLWAGQRMTAQQKAIRHAVEGEDTPMHWHLNHMSWDTPFNGRQED